MLILLLPWRQEYAEEQQIVPYSPPFDVSTFLLLKGQGRVREITLWQSAPKHEDLNLVPGIHMA